jgi:hypothetical protein
MLDRSKIGVLPLRNEKSLRKDLKTAIENRIGHGLSSTT